MGKFKETMIKHYYRCKLIESGDGDIPYPDSCFLGEDGFWYIPVSVYPQWIMEVLYHPDVITTQWGTPMVVAIDIGT